MQDASLCSLIDAGCLKQLLGTTVFLLGGYHGNLPYLNVLKCLFMNVLQH